MKDEEMAEEIANKRCHEIMCYGHCSFNSPKHHRCGEWHREYNCALEGLKAGRPQWHDLRKDPNDLPKATKPVLVILESGEPYVSWVSSDKGWWFCTNYYTGEDKVLAWCEIPTFDKE